MDKETFKRIRKVYYDIFLVDLNKLSKDDIIKKIKEFTIVMHSSDYIHKDGDKYNVEIPSSEKPNN